MALGCSIRAAIRGHITVSTCGFLCSGHRFAHNSLLHWYYVCRVLLLLYSVFEIAAGVILSNSVHAVDNSHAVRRSLFPGQSKLPAALTHIPLFSVVTCESSVLLVTLGHIVLHGTALVLEMVRVQRLQLERDIAVTHCCSLLVCRACGSLLGLWAATVSAGCTAQNSVHIFAEVDEDVVYHHQSCCISFTVWRVFVPCHMPDGISSWHCTT